MTELAASLEAILFAAADPTPLSVLTAATGHPEEDVLAALDELGTALIETGLALQVHAEHWQLVTAARSAEAVNRFLAADARTELSRAALETLAIVAYRGPVTRASLEEIRGVSSDVMIRNLLGRGLIVEQGKAPEPGRPTQYAVSHTFLEHVGLASLAELPPLDEAA